MSSAAVDSELRISDVNWMQGPLNIDLGANTTLYIDEDTDWTESRFEHRPDAAHRSRRRRHAHVDGRAGSGLDIIAGPGDGVNPGFGGSVVIPDLGNYPDLDTPSTPVDPTDNDDADELIDYDFSGIAVPASATLFDDDVTISATVIWVT